MAAFSLIASIVFAAQVTASLEDVSVQLRAPIILDYPTKCARGAKYIERVVLDFDISLSGDAENVRIVETSNTCFDKAARKSVENLGYWLQAPPDGLVDREGMRINLSFDRLESPAVSEQKIRNSVRRRLDRIRSNLCQDKDSLAELDRLAAVEQKYGDRFSLAEIAAFNLLCAIARADAGDHEVAINDLLRAQETGPIDQSDEGIANAVAVLELETADSR